VRKYYLAQGMIADAKPLAYVKAARDAGYDGVGLRLQKSPQYPIDPIVGDAPLIRDIKKVLDDAGMDVLDILAFYLQPPNTVDDFKPAMETAAQFGARYLVTQSDDEDRNRLCDNFGRFADLAAGFGLAPIIEFVPNRRLDTLPRALQLLRDTGHPDLPILVDPPHLIRSGGSAADLAAADARHFPYAQMSDGVLTPGEPDLALAKKLGAAQRRMPGEGTLPLREIFDALPAHMDISIEVIMERDPSITPTAWAKRGLELTKAFFGGDGGNDPTSRS
jgi:sugar phosphate isomerase/epimerase